MTNNIRLILVILMVLFIPISISESIFLSIAQAGGSSNSNPDTGLMAWINTGKTIDLDRASSLFNTIDYENTDGILGTYSLYVDNYNTEIVNMYITKDGYIAVFYGKYTPASKIISWSGDKTVFSKFATVISSVGQSLGYNVDYRNIKYYDYRYPNANRMLIATQSTGESVVGTYNYGNFQFNIPSYAAIYEVSYSFYLNDPYSGAANIAIDTTPVGGMTTNGVTYGVYDGYISTNTDHLFGIMSNQYAQSGTALIIIYRDDNDENNNRPTIVVNNADNYFDGVLENPDFTEPSSTYVPYYTPEPTPVPTRRTPRPEITVPMPTAVITDTSPTPVRTMAQPILGPINASVLLTSEKIDIELGEDAVLRLSAVSLITKPKMTVQVIIRVPSGISVTGSEFSQSGTNQYTSKYELQPGDNRDVEVKIRANHAGTFSVTGRIVYYFGGDVSTGEDYTQDVTITVRPRSSGSTGNTATTTNLPETTPGEPGFEIILSIVTVLLLAIFLRNKN